MGLNKQYLLYNASEIFGLIASNRSNIAFTKLRSTSGRFVLVGGAENIILWDLRTNEKRFFISNETRQEVSKVVVCPDCVHFAIGLIDGNVELYSLETETLVCRLPLHRTHINCLQFNDLGSKLASGGSDSSICIADVTTGTGVCRLQGHKGPITDIKFMSRNENILISCSKDAQIKFWDITTEHCFKTIADHKYEIYGICLMRFDNFLVTSASDANLRVYSIEDNQEQFMNEQVLDNLGRDESINRLKICYSGSIQMQGKGRVFHLISDEARTIVGSCTGNMIEIFYFCNEDEASARLSKRVAKSLKGTNLNVSTKGAFEMSLVDRIKRLPLVTIEDKINSFDMFVNNEAEIIIVLALANNSIKLISVDVNKRKSNMKLLQSIHNCGHHEQMRAVAFSSDSLSIVTASNDQLKMWSRTNNQFCLKTVDVQNALSICFVPGDRHVLVGLKSGKLLIVEILKGEIIEEIKAHDKEIWNVCLMPDQIGCVTSGGDETVKFWKFQFVKETCGSTANILSLLHISTLTVNNSILCTRLSNNGKYISVALLDNTVKIFFNDTFKVHQSLYGHNLPVLCMDISCDSSLIVTGSADRNLKIWGMDFGDCHRTITAHDDSIMALQFIPKTHLFFSCGKDGLIKQWDADTFQKLITLPGHIGAAISLAVSPNGKFLITIGFDKTLRLFERSNEILVLQDAQEKEREDNEHKQLAMGVESVIPSLPGLKLSTKRTVNAEKGSELLLECLELSSMYENQTNKNEIPPLMKAYKVNNTFDFLVHTLLRIRACDLEESLILLPFGSVCEMFKIFSQTHLQQSIFVEILCKTLVFLFKIHQKPIINNHTLTNTISNTHRYLNKEAKSLRELLGLNMYSLKYLMQEVRDLKKDYNFQNVSKTTRLKKKQQHEKKRHKHQIRY